MHMGIEAVTHPKFLTTLIYMHAHLHACKTKQIDVYINKLYNRTQQTQFNSLFFCVSGNENVLLTSIVSFVPSKNKSDQDHRMIGVFKGCTAGSNTSEINIYC